MTPQCIVIGASAGGVLALQEVVSQLPADFAVPVFVVLHLPPQEPSYMPDILSQAGSLPAIHPADHAKIVPGVVYIAPPDHHLLIDGGFVAVKRGPKENGFRPSIDALFRSAAYSYGPRATGVVLSGALNDGTSGLWSIKRLGGTAIVQDPKSSAFPSMPRSAMEYTEPDYSGSPSRIGALLVQLAAESDIKKAPDADLIRDDVRRLALETQLAAGIQVPDQTVLDLGELSPFTCPECRGTLIRIKEGKNFRFRCHTGHGFTPEALLAGLLETVGGLVWDAARGFEEASILLEHLGQHLSGGGDAAMAVQYLQQSRQLAGEAEQLRELATRPKSVAAEDAG